MKVENSRVIVTGGAGFIGSHLVDRLLANGNSVLIIDDFSSGSWQNLAHHGTNAALNVADVSILNESALYDLFRGTDFVFHLACRNVRLSLSQPTIVHDVNATGTLNVLKAAAKAQARRFLYCSSSEVNGTADIVPMPEDYHFKPETIYGASKLTGEYYTQVFERSGWLETVVVRPHNTYGPREHYDGIKGEVIPRFILWALAGQPPLIYGTGKQTRDFTFVTDTADFLIKIMECDSARGMCLNLCRGQEISILDIARIVGELTGITFEPIMLPGRPSDVLRLFGDTTRLLNIIGECPRITIQEGLARTLEWFRNHVPVNKEILDSMSQENWRDVRAEDWKPVQIFGGNVMNIPLARPALGDAEAVAVREVLRSGWVTQGPQVAEFESEFARFVGSQYACALSSCTTALHLSLLAVGVKPGDEVITVSHSFIATANCIRHCGAVPVFVDIEPHTYNMDPDRIEEAISNKTSAILCVHQMGMPCNLDRISEIAERYHIPLVEDAACAVGSRYFDKTVMNQVGKPRGDAVCFSFHPRKVITTGDGGMVTTDSHAIDSRIRLLRQHAMSQSDMSRHQAGSVVFEEYTELGYNYRMTDIQASIGRTQLRRLADLIKKRRLLADRYRHLLPSVIGLPDEPTWAESNWQSFCVRLPDYVDQKIVMQVLLDDGIATRRGIMCSHREPAYDKEIWRTVEGERTAVNSLLQSESAQDHCIVLPLFFDMTESQQQKVADAINRVCV